MPNQKSSPYPDKLVEAVEEAAQQVVLDKVGVRRTLVNIEKSILSGSVSKPDADDEQLSVTVVLDSFVMNPGEQVRTDIGDGHIDTVYTSKEDTARVSVKFSLNEVKAALDL
jgi:hypothetical protein